MSKLLELFLSNRKEDKEEFQKEFIQVLSEVPNRVGNKENFWIYFFLGSILTLPDTELMSKLGITKILVKVSDDQKTIKLYIVSGGETILRVITTQNNAGFTKDDIAEIEGKYPHISKDKVVYRISENELIMKDEKEQDNSSDSSNKFIEISKVSEQNFDQILEILSNSNSEEEVIVERPVDKLFTNLVKVYNRYKEKEQNTRRTAKDFKLKLKKEPEALHQAFIYGFMKMNMEANSNCFIEFGAGLGVADLVLEIGYIAVIVECKVDLKTAGEAIKQINDKGYFYLEILGEFKSTFLVGMNFNERKGKNLKVEEHKIFKPEGLINVLMEENIEEDEIAEGQLEEKIKEELEFLCYSKNIGICNPNNSSNKNEFGPSNNYVGSFSALVLGQVLEYCSRNEQYKFERITIAKEEKSKIQNIEFTILGSNSKLKLDITEFTDKAGNTSPEHEDKDGRYNIKIEITKNNDKKSIYKISFPNENSNKVEVKLEKSHEHTHDTPGKRYTRNVKDNSNDDYIDSGRMGFSSTDSKPSSEGSGASPQKPGSLQHTVKNDTQNIDIKKLIQEIESGEGSYLHEILKDYKDFINSESNLQLFLKGLFMNVETDGGKIVAEIEVSAGQAGKIDLLLKFPDRKGMILELKFCDEVKDMVDKQDEAWEQLKSYTDKGILEYILDPEKSKVIAIVFCKENAECIVKTEDFQTLKNAESIVETKDFPTPESNFEVSIDSGMGSSRSSSLSGNSFDSSSPSTSLSNTPPPSPGMKRKALSP